MVFYTLVEIVPPIKVLDYINSVFLKYVINSNDFVTVTDE
jgi:hypothetical protein